MHRRSVSRTKLASLLSRCCQTSGFTALHTVRPTLLQAHVQDYQGTCSYLGATLQKAGITADPSMAHVRQLLTEAAILPLGSQYLHERLQPHTKAVSGAGQAGPAAAGGSCQAEPHQGCTQRDECARTWLWQHARTHLASEA
jgi:hypothetical protein